MTENNIKRCIVDALMSDLSDHIYCLLEETSKKMQLCLCRLRGLIQVIVCPLSHAELAEMTSGFREFC